MNISSVLPAVLPPEPQPTQTAEVGKQFEMLLVKQFLAELPMPGLEGTQAETFLSMFHDALAQELVEGGGLGLADQLERATARHATVAPPTVHRPAPRADHPESARLSSPFGVRRDPLDGHSRQHQGIDLAAPEGSPIHVPQAGVVRFAGKAGGYGQLVIVDHGDGLESRYAHCSTLEVRAGDHVSSGQRLAQVGATGRATGPHLHFEVRQRGIPIDPQEHPDFAQTLTGLIRGEDGDPSLSRGVVP